MALVHADFVAETTTTTGTGTYSLAGAVTGFQNFVNGIGTGNTCYYSVTDGTDWEVGIGTVTDATPDTLARTTVLSSSNSGSAVNWSAGSKTVVCTIPSSKFVGNDSLNTFTTTQTITPATEVSPLVLTGGTLTGTTSRPLIDATQAWNNAGGTFTALKLNITDTASATASLLMDLQVGGTSKFKVDKSGAVQFASSNLTIDITLGSLLSYGAAFGYYGVNLQSDRMVSWASGANGLASPDLKLVRDAANTLAQRNGTNAQAFRVYNTYTDASNYERAFIQYSSNLLLIGHQAAGTGTVSRQVILQTNGQSYIGLNSTAGFFNISSSGHWLAGTDVAYDIGASGANRPRVIYVGSVTTSIVRTSYINNANDTNTIWQFTNGSGNAIFSLGATAPRIQFGGTTSSFPALTRNAAALETKLADDSAYAQHNMQIAAIVDGVTAPSATSGLAKIYVDTADGDLKVIFGDGTVKTIVVDT